jgi:hypothetical protein
MCSPPEPLARHRRGQSLDEPAFHANGRRYAFDMELGNVRRQNPIHGLLSRAAGWEVVEVEADATSAWAARADLRAGR